MSSSHSLLLQEQYLSAVFTSVLMFYNHDMMFELLLDSICLLLKEVVYASRICWLWLRKETINNWLPDIEMI